MKNNILISILTFSILVLPTIVFAQPVYKPLVGIPGVNDPNTNFNSYINTLYGLSIAIAALLAVIKIIIAGVKYMLSDMVSSKGAAKEDIQSALLGLLIIASAFLILNEINPQLTQTKLITDKVTRPASYKTTATASTPPVGGNTTAPRVDPTGVPTGEAKWVEVDGPVAPVVLPLRPSTPPLVINCANQAECQTAAQTCVANRGNFTISGGVQQCIYTVERQMICQDRRVQLPMANQTGNPVYRNDRNCYDALAMCLDRTPELQATAWEQGNFTCKQLYR